MRERLAQRRYSENTSLQHVGIRYQMQVGFFDDGRVGEVFLGMEKAAGTLGDVNSRDIGILISMLLQQGMTVAEIAKSVTRDENNQPEGLVGAVLAFLASYEAEDEAAEDE